MTEVAKPKSILRGHNAQVHAAVFIRRNERLATGDAEGFVILWDLTIVRPRAVWRAHENAILGIAGWGNDKLITHGRDNKLIVWKLTSSDEPNLSTALPLEEVAGPRPQPWMVHLLEVNTMNFCSFASCSGRPQGSAARADELMVAVPNTLKSEAIDVFHLPSQTRWKTVESDGKNGMVMALALFYRNETLILISAYENGLTLVFALSEDTSCLAKLLYRCQLHSQPVLSLDISLEGGYFLTSGADAVIGKHPIPNPGSNLETSPLKKVDTKHAGQQSIRIRSDGKIFATAGWDARVRVYSTKTMKEVAALKWHQVGCYAVAFSELAEPQKDPGDADQSDDSASVVRFETVKSRRVTHAQTAHWLAAGSKDGKVSLWVIY